MQIRSLASISAVALALTYSSLGHAQSGSIGVNAAVKGDVTIASPEQTAKQAVVKDDVFLGQVINSQKLSSLQIMLKDQTIFTVGPECDLTINKFVYDPSANTNGMTATVTKGMFRFMSGNISKSGIDAVSINTPVASMGIRGTMVEGLVGANAIQLAESIGIIPPGTPVDANGASIFVLRGPGPNTTGINTKGEVSITSGNHVVMVNETNRAAFVPSAGAAPIMFSLSLVVFETFSQGLRTIPTSPNSYKNFKIGSQFSPSLSTTSSSGSGSGTSTGGATNTGTGTVTGGATSAGTGTSISNGVAIAVGVAATVSAIAIIDDGSDGENSPISP